jgi:hypothetical protein
MRDKQEIDLLGGLLRDLDREEFAISKSRQFLVNLALWIFVAILLFLAFGGRIGWTYILLALFSFSIGILIRSEDTRLLTRERWPILRQYFDREKIRKRLLDLGA